MNLERTGDWLVYAATAIVVIGTLLGVTHAPIAGTLTMLTGAALIIVGREYGRGEAV